MAKSSNPYMDRIPEAIRHAATVASVQWSKKCPATVGDASLGQLSKLARELKLPLSEWKLNDVLAWDVKTHLPEPVAARAHSVTIGCGIVAKEVLQWEKANEVANVGLNYLAKWKEHLIKVGVIKVDEVTETTVETVETA